MKMFSCFGGGFGTRSRGERRSGKGLELVDKALQKAPAGKHDLPFAASLYAEKGTRKLKNNADGHAAVTASTRTQATYGYPCYDNDDKLACATACNVELECGAASVWQQLSALRKLRNFDECDRAAEREEVSELTCRLAEAAQQEASLRHANRALLQRCFGLLGARAADQHELRAEAQRACELEEQVQQLLRDRRELKAGLDEVTSMLEVATTRMASSEDTLRELYEAKQREAAAHAAAEAELAAERLRSAEAEAQLAKLQHDFNAVVAEAQQLQAERDAAESQAAEERQARLAAEARCWEAEQQSADVNHKVAEQTKALEQCQHDLAAAHQKLAQSAVVPAVEYEEVELQEEGGGLGVGGAGTVNLAWHQRYGTCALKMPIMIESAGGEDVAAEMDKRALALSNEGRLMASLPPHLNVAPLLAEVQHNGQACGLLLPLYRRGSVADMIMENRITPDDRPLIWRVLRDGALGLQHLHSSRVAHLDFKVNNLLVAGDGTTVLADMGTAARLRGDDPDVYSCVCSATGCSPVYCSPELWDNRYGPVTLKEDVWAWGMAALCLLMGSTLDHRPTEEKILQALDCAEAQVWPDLARLVRCCLAEEPCNRPTAPHILAGLDEIRP